MFRPYWAQCVSPGSISELLCGTGWEKTVHGWRGGERRERGDTAQAVFHLPAVWGVHKQSRLRLHTYACRPSSCATASCFYSLSHTLPGSLTLCIFLSPTQSHSCSCFASGAVTVFSQFTSSKQLPFSFASHFFAAWSPLVPRRCPLIRFGLGAISFGHVCGGGLPWRAQYLGKALRLCRCRVNHVSCA